MSGNEKHELRAALRARRRAHVAALPKATRALILLRPPTAIARMTAGAAVIGLYHATPQEAPARGYAQFFQARGQAIALPWFADRGGAMRFREWRDPIGDADLEPGPWGALQPGADARELAPAIVFVPLLGFTNDGRRLGQGGGHYDRWLAAHPEALALGLAWDCQCEEDLPIEAHDRALRAVITPTRIHGDIG